MYQNMKHHTMTHPLSDVFNLKRPDVVVAINDALWQNQLQRAEAGPRVSDDAAVPLAAERGDHVAGHEWHGVRDCEHTRGLSKVVDVKGVLGHGVAEEVGAGRNRPVRRVVDGLGVGMDPCARVAQVSLHNLGDGAVAARANVEQKVAVVCHNVRERLDDGLARHVLVVWRDVVVAVRVGVHSAARLPFGVQRVRWVGVIPVYEC